jgi:hypothetical protein
LCYGYSLVRVNAENVTLNRTHDEVGTGEDFDAVGGEDVGEGLVVLEDDLSGFDDRVATIAAVDKLLVSHHQSPPVKVLRR